MAFEVDKQGNLYDGEDTFITWREAHGNAPDPPTFTYHTKIDGEEYSADSLAELAETAVAPTRDDAPEDAEDKNA